MLRVKVEISRGLVKKLGAAEAAKVASKLTPGLARNLGGAIRERVQGSGNLAGQPVPDWDDTYKPKLVSARYPDGVTGKQTASGAELFTSARAYHSERGTRRGTMSVTGGNWAGLALVIWNEVRSELRFRDRSEGQDARVINGKSRPIKVNNALKAWTIFNKWRVQFMALSERELQAVTTSATEVTALIAASIIPINFTRGGPPGLDVDAIFKRALGNARTIPQK